MNYISEKDIYEIRLASLVSNIDKDVVLELYQPIIGSSATILYLTLLKQRRNEDDEDIIFTHNILLSSMQIAPGAFLSARHILEGVGLLRTYQKDEKDMSLLIYTLYAPLSPKEFFDDVLFKGLLIQSVGEKEAKRLAFHYRVDLSIPKGYKETTSSFVDVFNPNFEDSSFRKNIKDNIVGHTSGRVQIKFSYDLFFKYLEENSQIQRSAFTKKDIDEIERLATLFSLNETTMASIVINDYDPNNTSHINYASLAEKAKEQVRFPFLQKKTNSKSNVTSDSILAKKIRLMEETSPSDWLSLLQQNTKPATSDLNIVLKLSTNYALSNGIINALIDYVLTKNNNVLSLNYCEKIAASLLREGITTTIDAMNYLNKVNLTSRKPKKDNQDFAKIKNEEKSSESKTDSTDEVSDAELESILNNIDSMKRGDK